MTKKDKSGLDDCIKCKAKCCRYVALDIDKPTCKRDYDNIRWYLMHDNIQVFIDDEGTWTLEFITNCQNLLPDYRCSNYAKRPKICRDYPNQESSCEYLGSGLHYKKLFKKPQDFERYLTQRGIDWKWKRK